MWWSRLFFCGFFALSACGFQPMYGQRSPAGGMLRVEISNIPDRDGQYLRNALIDRLYLRGYPQEAPYRLDITDLKKEITNIGIRKDASSTRGQMDISATLRLVDKETGAVLLERPLHAMGGYNLLDNQLATLVSKESLTEHVLQEMSDTIVTELGLYFQRQGGL